MLAASDGHITGAELVERCRVLDPGTTPSTVYRTLDVLEEIGLVRHGHGADGREEFHVLPAGQHGHLHCSTCGATWEIDEERGEAVAAALRAGTASSSTSATSPSSADAGAAPRAAPA